jgi:alpha-tubulin suppressor-like RCC1 family protein
LIGRVATTLGTGRTFVWGDGRWGKLGLGSLADAIRPTEIESLRAVGVHKIAAGYSHTGALCGMTVGQCNRVQHVLCCYSRVL